MDYKTFPPSEALSSFVNFFWTLEVPSQAQPTKQRIVPDGNIELAFILGDDIKRYTSETDYLIQPRSMVLGQTVSPFYIQPTGYVNTFSASFFPYGFSDFISQPIKNLRDKETSIYELFDKDEAEKLERSIVNAQSTQERIEILEAFLFSQLSNQRTIENIVKSTVDTLFSHNGNVAIHEITDSNPSKKRQLERQFLNIVGVSPKQLSKLIRLQTALKLIIDKEESLTDISYQSNYYDQSHFIKDFKEFTGVTPRDFLDEESMALSLRFYR
ncbi:AraC family transcriptional regulator [Marinomonas mediterranea]|jgi:AraC-type DNA-binding domain-containing proteins|uniref:Transcriptional regulator, AraC family n=1 Tax=Marinomonas mediterranea (strain ATCC 700492 / JCM 21426 / NBRC 103028 / MMB-1) TaxID=717774 RepID=F2K375_MARM1|nr:AraC family transcriptional regulator [Marinomonas mediterranea]ADZ90128.1 transcriptional regulator, AraC family [Marinomonas mediterranea MMB-1]WCN08192.1 helix-turn-helix domain-containing protein [Marinomonas mediterranea]WCN12259.1 helix-turn-helix domain-containing protein [Marinomonas mediterranea]WCN16332.1 helix-turn-helix domain-containing protein [Marinomonas mediterranea MMB-1]